ncbi:putative zinc transporter At3g08650 isoform X1 [Triticum dicoccoides]|uniref:putative zinc transporter At3g08650 isoform X1 n=1 Tax=Triticum dicoccoides TaxID=85692 RepID=UPI00188F29E9|nr:putative zinc transporter At3g08650 isoform X1 [Triticum dicoccoides]
MDRKVGVVLVCLLFLLIGEVSAVAQTEVGHVRVTQEAPDLKLEDAGRHDVSQSGRVSVYVVAWSTLAMAAATGLGAVPFFFLELEAQWAGLCNGLAAGVMLAASFDLVQEGQMYGSGSWVVFGILSGGIFIWLCKKILEQHGEVSMLDIKGADASKVILVVGIMTLHSFGEGSGVGVSFVGSKGLSQGLLVTIAIAVHNIPEGLAVSMVLSSRGVSPQKAMLWSIITSLPQAGLIFVHQQYISWDVKKAASTVAGNIYNPALLLAGGLDIPHRDKLNAIPHFPLHLILHDINFGTHPTLKLEGPGCMIWIVIAEVLPDAFKEATPSQVASAGTLAVAFMETLSTVLQGFTDGHGLEDTSGFLVSLVFGLGPLFGGIILVAFSLAFNMPHPLLTGVASGIAFRLASWRPLQLVMSLKMGLFTTLFLLLGGSVFYHLVEASILMVAKHKKSSVNVITSSSGLSLSVLTQQSLLACGCVFLHAYAEGLALGVAARKASGLGRYMVLPVSLHGLPRGAAVASCVYGATDSWRGALAAAALTGFAGPSAAIGAILAKIGYDGLDYWMVIACGALIPSFGRVFRCSLRLDARNSVCGLLIGFGFAWVCLMSTRFICLHTPYCNSAPEAVT